MKRLISFALGVLIIFATGLGWLAIEFVSRPPSRDSAVEVFEVSPQKGLRQVASELRDRGFIASSTKFVWFARVLGKQDQIRVGEYALRKNMVPREILEVLISGKSIERKITISEGLNIYEIAKLLQNAGIGTSEEFLAIAKDKATAYALVGDEAVLSLEGYLYPETYSYTKFTSLRNLIMQMVSNFKKQYAKVNVPSDFKLNRHQIVTLASIIEKETGAAVERPLISSVFHNRMKKNMKLQTDPTVIYGILDAGNPYPENIRREDLQAPTRFNTYTFVGLPPGPIANPGLEALRAAVQPEASSYLFFVSRNDGTHIFSENYENHRKAVVEFQLNRANREGKSWRDLKKTE